MDIEEAIEYAFTEEEHFPPKPLTPEEPPGSPKTGNLTRREQEVATLISQGLTNNQSATELSISEYTVANHVAKILKKLELSSRSQITAWVVERRSHP